MIVNTMLIEMDSQELTEWMAYYTIVDEDETRAALAARAQANVNKPRTR